MHCTVETCKLSRQPCKLKTKAHLFTFLQLLLCSVKVIVGEEALQEVCDRVTDLVGFLLDEPHEVLHHIPSSLVDHSSNCQITYQVLGICLNSIQKPAQE